MSSNSIKIIFFTIILILFSSCSFKNTDTKKANNSLKENLYISVALDREYNKFYLQSAKLYEELYNSFNKEQYYRKTILLYHQAKKFKTVQKLILNNLDKYPKSKEMMLQEYIIVSVQLKEYNKALDMAKKLLKEFNSAKNYTIVADIYYLMNNYEQSSKYYESAYAKNNDVKVLLNLTNIFYSYLNKKKEAISYLETYHREYSCNKTICQRLLKYYQENQNIDGMISISNTLLKSSSDTYTPVQLNKIYDFMVNLYLQKDVKLAIKFLETNHYDDKKLLTLYSINKKYKKALDLINKMYIKTNNKVLLGQMAILEYESSIDKQKSMKDIINNFEESLAFKSNATYENFYGYILVDHNIDLKKGLKLIKKAIKKSPNNYAYKDSLAYAYYKNGNCTKAYTIMEEIKNKLGLDNSEIKKHWNEIKNCKENN